MPPRCFTLPALATAGLAALTSSSVLAQDAAQAAHGAPWPLTTALAAALALCALLLQRARHREAKARQEITARQQTELELRTRFKIFVDLNPAPISVSTLTEGRLLAANPAWEKLFGWPIDEALGRTTLELGIWLERSDREKVISALRQSSRILSSTTQCGHRDGRPQTVCYHATRVDYDGQPCMLAAVIDMSGEIAAREALERLNQELEARVAERTRGLEAANKTLAESLAALSQTQDELIHARTMASLGNTVAGISHELNTPLGNARLAGSTLADQLRDFQEQSADHAPQPDSLAIFLGDLAYGTRLLNQNIERAADLVASFKLVAMDRSSERRREFMLDGMLKDLLSTLRPGLKKAACELKIQLDQNLKMDSYPGPLGQVITNLVQNAVEHNLAGRAHGLLQIRAHGRGADEVELTIEDDGTGIAAEHLPHLFEPFYSPRITHGDSSIGLALAHNLVTTVLGGSIEAHAEAGLGTMFRIRLPRCAPQPPQV